MQSITVISFLLVAAISFANADTESCVPSTLACKVQGPPYCCLPSTCVQPETGAASCVGQGVSCTPTNGACTPGTNPTCCLTNKCKPSGSTYSCQA